MPIRDPRVDAYIKKAPAFAQPILVHLREVVHTACPDVVETMKWSVPHFDYEGMFCSMASFKQHAMFNFWKYELLKDMLPAGDDSARGQFGRMTSVKDLPSDRVLIRIIRAAVRLNDEGVKTPRRPPVKKPPVRTPPALMAALRKNRAALAAYELLSPSHKREYVEWITSAKTDATRDRRIATALEWIGKGRGRNWKYERPA